MGEFREQRGLLEFHVEGKYMITIQGHKNEERIVTLTFGDDYQIQMTQYSLEILIDKLQGLAESNDRGHWSTWCLDADCDHDAFDDDAPEVGYQEREPFETEDE